MALRIKPQCIKTRERIVQCALELFNRQSERSVRTYPTAAPRKILPGNPCYHVANKRAIIAELSTEYQTRVDSFLHSPFSRQLCVEDKRHCLTSINNPSAKSSNRYRHF